MDEYEKKFADMQKYIPFLEAMIERLQKVTDKSREVQLLKMQQLHGILTDNKRKLRIETLQKCEDVLQKLHNKVEKGSNAGVNLTNNKKEEQASIMKTSSGSCDKKSYEKMEETPASPSPPASPDEQMQSKTSLSPIIIPTERKHDYSTDKIDSKPASPDQSECVSTKEPIIIPTERKLDPPNDSPKRNKSQNKVADSKNTLNRKNCPSVISNTEIPKPSINLTSPENRLARSKEGFSTSSKNAKATTPLLVSLNEPPLSMEDLAELLNDGSNSNADNLTSSDRKTQQSANCEKLKIPKDKLTLEILKKSEKNPGAKTFVLTQEDIDRESNRRWEEIDKHIVMFGRKGLQTDGKTQSVLQSNHVPGGSTAKKPVSRDNPLSPVGKDRGSEPRYADNYERISRQDRCNSDLMPGFDINVPNSAFSNIQSNSLGFHKQNESYQSVDDRELFSRRPNLAMDIHRPNSDSDFRRDNDYYMHRSMPHNQPRDYRGGYDQNVQQMPLHSYQHHQNHSDMWKMGPNAGPGPLDHHISPPPLFGPNANRCRPIISPNGRSDMHHNSYMDTNFAEDIRISPQPPPLMSPILTAPPFNPRGFSDNRQFDVPFDRLGDFPSGVRSRSADGNYHDNQRSRGQEIPYSTDIARGSMAWSRGTGGDHAPMRKRNKERFPPVEKGPPRPPSLLDPHLLMFNRRDDWDRHQQNDIPPRFNREPRNLSERDPRFRKDPSPQASTSSGVPASKRDPRLLKDCGQSSSPSKANETSPGSINRDPRKRNSESKNQTKSANVSKPVRINNQTKVITPGKAKESAKADVIKLRRSSAEKVAADKLVKDKDTMQSPLESLYGAIDTTAKTGKGYGLQKFKIPKIKKPEVIPRPPTPPKPSSNNVRNEVESYDKAAEEKTIDYSEPEPVETRAIDKQEEKKMEVSSTTDELALSPDGEFKEVCGQDPKEAECREPNEVPEKADNKVDESEATVDTSTVIKIENNTLVKETPAGSEHIPIKDEITRELIEKMIKTSLEQGEGRKLLEQARLLQKLGEGLAHSKKFKKIQKIIEGQSESSSSETEEIIETKKSKKKRRVIVSESSDDEELNEDHPSITTPDLPEKNTQIKKKQRKSSSKALKLKEKVKTGEENVSEEKPLVEESPKDMKEESTESPEADRLQEKESVEVEQEVVPLTPKIRKKPARRRNSLEMLQEDIREMFISEGVVTATGHRMCRLIKEADGNLKSVDEKVKGIYGASSPEHRNDSGSEVGIEVPGKRRNRSKSKTSKLSEISLEEVKSTVKTRKPRKRAAKVSKQYVSSSESEEEPKLATRSRTAASRKNLSETMKDTIKDSFEKSEESVEQIVETPILRRSERVSMREPRVIIEKTDLGKIDSSKIMFDTSSDESFGIDVSELTAAVDISLHSDRQKCSDDGDSSLDFKKLEEKSKETKKRNINESKTDATGKLEEDTTMNVASDASNCSNTNDSSAKRMTCSTPVSNTNDELLTNLLGELVKDKEDDSSIMEKSLEKENDAKEEVETEGASNIVPNKRPPLAKRKRRRNNWQTGSLPKSKRKGKKKPIRNIRQCKKPSPLLRTEKVKSKEVKEGSVDIKNIDESPSPKQSEAEKKSEVSTIDEKNASISHEIKEEKDDEETSKEKSLLTTETLIQYAWTGQEKYKCLLCNFSGKSIVHHYKMVHPKNEVMISRLMLLDAKRAIDESKDEAFLKLSEKVNTGPNRKYTCRFCLFMTEGPKVTAMETFYEHCTTHTGEYRFRCRSCTYTTPLKSSMRAHYYKVCRKTYENLALAVIEDSIPDEDLAYGYLCSLCNFIQFKETNLKKHIEDYHKNKEGTEVIKINMSSYLDLKENVEHSDLEEDLKAEDHASNVETSIVESSEDSKQKRTGMVVQEVSAKSNVQSEESKSDNLSPSKMDSPQEENENPLSSKLSAFVCPPELENKEVEIQRERQKTMQELLNNYGTKFKNNAIGNGLSIIDKLKDKITTLEKQSDDSNKNDDQVTINVDIHSAGNETQIANENQSEEYGPMSAKRIKLIFGESPAPLSPINTVEVTNVQPSNNELLQDEKDSVADKSEKKPRDPLMSLVEETRKDFNSVEELSDGEPATDINRPYDSSDTSEELSDAELSTDVNSLLQETINTSIKAPMMTTIQRLAAQLQSSKSVVSSPDKSEKTDSSKPIVMPLSELRNFVEKQKLGMTTSSEPSDTDTSRSNTPKNFIRLRRLSGDKLSSGLISMETLSSTEKEKTSEPPMKQQEECSFLKIENVVSLAPNAESDVDSPLVNDIRKAVAISPVKNSGISVLKKGNTNIVKKIRKPIGKIDGIIPRFPVVAPSSPGQTITVLQPVPNPVGAPIKSVITSLPTSGASVVNKTATGPATKAVAIPIPSGLKPIISNSVSTSKLIASTSAITINNQGKNFKLLKVLRSPVSIKPKDVIPLNTQKEKTFEAFTTMLQVAKLRNMYKCMDRSCTYSTDVPDLFGQHYEAHKQKYASNEQKNLETKGEKPPYGFQKCAYCCETSSTWDELYSHYKKKHTFCAYQCGYCFYRAFTHSYVDIHQSTVHHGKPPSVICGAKDHHPIEIIDRREYVYPFICKHECNKLFYVPEAFLAHLTVKHGATLSIFKCHLCPASALKAESLISHYKLHGMYRYQCLYCLFGADATFELHHHLSNLHCNRPPKILERSLPPTPVRDKDVLLQLVIKNLDDDFKVSELKCVSEISVVDSIVRRPRKEVLKPLLDPSLSQKAITTYPPKKSKLALDHAEVIHIIGTEQSQNSSMTTLPEPKSMQITDVRGGVSAEELQIASASISKANDPQDVHCLKTERMPQEETELRVRCVNEQIKPQIVNTVNALSLQNNINITDEFVNINVLDNPEFLQTAERMRATGKFSVSRLMAEDKNDDSDIEILECIAPITKAKLQLMPIKDSMKPFFKLKQEIKEPDAGKCTPTITCSSNENSNISIELSGSTEVTTLAEEQNYKRNKDDNKDSDIVQKPPLTLDDIKDTGLAGKDLYKCGNDGCNFEADHPGTLRGHIGGCTFLVENMNLKCIHCTKRFVKVGNLIDHYKIHGLKRFGCSLCNMRYTLACQAVAHMKTKHRVTSHKLVPADPTNPSPDALFVVQPLKGPAERKGKKLNRNKSFELTQAEPTVYGPNEIENLPRPAIYNREVRCAVCPYTTKVRTNIIRHLQLHAKDETVPESGPVNPVPCLDKKEKMFDKMVNLASSSHQNGRMGGKAKEAVTDSEADLLPKFIPEKQRYVCCVNDCNCLTISEDLLRCHLKALHPEEPFFRCPHCPPTFQDSQTIPIDKIGVHLKMHDTRLYKCSHCNHHHYHRHVVERHLTDKHPEKRPFVKVIREIENPESLERSQMEEIEESNADADGNHWKCNMCEYKCAYKAEMVTHAASAHDERSQFKCTLCSFKTSGKINFEQHILSKHISDPEADYTMVYEKMKGARKPDNVEVATTDEPFDTTPLWRRDMPRIRHIRGILLEEENEKKMSDTPAKSTKRKPEADSAGKPTKIKPKFMLLDGTILIEKGKSENKTTGKVYTNAELIKKFGPYGRPSGNMYNCTICSTYFSKYRQDIRDHIYMELKYWRWHCTDCGHLAVSHSRMLKHENKVHKDKKPVTVELEAKEDVETWVINLMNLQRDIMKGEGGESAASSTKSKATTSQKTSPPTIILEDPDVQIIPGSNMEASCEPTKTVDLTAAISKLSKDSNESDNDDDDGDALIIDSKEPPLDIKDTPPSDKIASSSKDNEKIMYTCKHCTLEFAGLRGFKIHVQINHLKRLAFICPYCDRSTNSETMMKAHIRTKHPGETETIVRNPQSNGPELSNDFWEKEYGIIIPKKLRGKKRKIENVNTAVKDDKPSAPGKCTTCGFTAVNSTGLKAHMRTHAKKDTLKCAHCSFTANAKSDIWQHSEINHPASEWKAEEITTPGSSSSDHQPVQYIKKRRVEDYAEDIEEETSVLVEQPEKTKRNIYTCVYCKTAKSFSLATIKAHWSQCHKIINEKSVYQTGVPFKYSESVGNIVETSHLIKCGYCPKKGSMVAIKSHIKQKHTNLPTKIVEGFDNTQDIWICEWCEEKIEGGSNKTSHHTMFHSHLPMRFQKEQESLTKQKGYACPVCPFISVTLSRMTAHVAKHKDIFRCKRCSKKFYSLQKATQHSTSDHAGLAAAFERVAMNIEVLMSKVSESDLPNVPEDEPQEHPSIDIFRNLGVARKSTTKQLLKKSSNTPKCVARKSTHPLPRYPPGLVFNIEESNSEIDNTTPQPTSGWSYYGRPSSPVNLANLNTVMSLGAIKMKVKCTQLAQLMNIDGRVELVDCKKAKIF